MGAIAHKLPSRHLKKGENSCKVRSSLENGGNFVSRLRSISTHPYKSTLLGKLTHKKSAPKWNHHCSLSHIEWFSDGS